MSTVAPAYRPLVPLPVSNEYPRTNEPHETETTSTRYGHCAWFCAQELVPAHGASVDEHGEMCISIATGLLDAQEASGHHMSVAVSMATPYTHGTYRREDTWGRRELDYQYGVVQLGGLDQLVDDGEVTIYMRPGTLRSLAASLLYTADNLEKIAQPVEVPERADHF